MKKSFYSIQLDESTNLSKKSHLLYFVRVGREGELRKERHCSLNLPGSATNAGICEALNNLMPISWNVKLNRKKCVGLYTDGFASVTRHLSGVTAKMNNFNHLDLSSTHCIIQSEQLMLKRTSPELHKV